MEEYQRATTETRRHGCDGRDNGIIGVLARIRERRIASRPYTPVISGQQLSLRGDNTDGLDQTTPETSTTSVVERNASANVSIQLRNHYLAPGGPAWRGGAILSDINSWVAEQAGQLYTRCMEGPRTKRYYSWIFVPSTIGGLDSIVEDLERGLRYCITHGSNIDFVLIARHEDHIHVNHVCTSSNTSCRCSWLRGSESYRTSRRQQLARNVRAVDIDTEGWENVLRYFLDGGRRIERLIVGSRTRRSPVGAEMLQETGRPGNGQVRVVETDAPEDDRNLLGEPLGAGEAYRPSSCLGDAAVVRQSGYTAQESHEVRQEIVDLLLKTGGSVDGSILKGRKRKQREIEILIRMYPTCPINAVNKTIEFINNTHTKYISSSDRDLAVIIKNWSIILNQWSVQQFWDYYSSPGVRPYFNLYAFTNCKSSFYYTPAESLEIAVELLSFQFDGDFERIHKFVYDLFDVVEKNVPKRNTLSVLSPPNAGKNFFFDAVCSYFLNYGIISTLNKHSPFGYQDMDNRRIVLWNEPNYESNETETLKMLLGGDSAKIRVKYLGDQDIQGPPIIILTNHFIPLFSDPAFESRICQYEWKAAPFLKHCRSGNCCRRWFWCSTRSSTDSSCRVWRCSRRRGGERFNSCSTC
ncbi:uncharacterized protein LOC126898252 [Daktulosphaira vitifoliae]|uniref:uncharacterized protein LOC126898252 n=1 Tax=Daktulosphaira vitifoliae TaxID=58002 RepID=UPI0021AAC8D9|nr:uncharacterized protein LOC126898252 [Daktulosphaira vitifoliae]